MQAMVYTTYGSPDVLKLKEIQKPILQDNEVLIQVDTAAANAGDWHLLRGNPFMIRLTAGLRMPKHQILGADVAGRVTAVGRNVTQFQPGDDVFGDLSDSGFGAFAEYVAAPAHAVALKPARMTFAEAATVPSAAMTALHPIRTNIRCRNDRRFRFYDVRDLSPPNVHDARLGNWAKAGNACCKPLPALSCQGCQAHPIQKTALCRGRRGKIVVGVQPDHAKIGWIATRAGAERAIAVAR
jgi:hypothetical protein